MQLNVREETRRIRREVRKQTIGYILAAFGLVAGLAWNEAIKALIEKYFPASGSSVEAKFLYAALITIVVVVLGIYLARISEERTSDASEQKKDQQQ